jgi:hypothetical protein
MFTHMRTGDWLVILAVFVAIILVGVALAVDPWQALSSHQPVGQASSLAATARQPSVTPLPSHTPTATPWPTAVPTAAATPPPVPPSWGIEMQAVTPERGFGLAQEAGVHWLRNNGLFWDVVEATPGARDWQAVDGLESELRAAYAAGMETILIVRAAPEWARRVPGSECSAVRPEALDAMAAFVADAVARYKDAPYGVKYWELGNEPDVDPRLVGPSSPFGCWGNMDDSYYGGEYYARMLKAVYPAVKAADPEAQVLIGGLLLDQDPSKDEKANPPGRFLEGILRAGGGDYFDAVSFHAYVGYDGQLHDWETLPGSWQERGGVVAGKVDLIRKVLKSYGYQKPLLLTEAALLCGNCTEKLLPGYLQAQAAYVPRLYLRSVGLGMAATLWYTLDGPGWRQAGLLDGDQQPRPAYQALSTMTSLVGDARYLHPLNDLPGIEGYAFATASGAEVWALWSRDGATLDLRVPPNFSQAVDYLGSPLPVQAGHLEVGFSPVYLLPGDEG